MFRIGAPITVKTYVVLGAFCLVAVWIGYYGGNARVDWQQSRVDWLTEQNRNLYQQVDQLEYQRNILQVELDVERAAGRTLQAELRGALEDNANITRELTFYQRVMAPEQSANGLGIDSFVLAETATERRYYFRLILLQLERAQQLVSGRYTIVLRGQYQGERREMNLFDLAESESELGQFNMSYFSLHEATFYLPENFAPDVVVVRVQSGRNRALERSYDWASLLSEQAEPAAERSDAY